MVIEPLRAHLVDLDTDAYLSSPVAIAAHSHGRWPIEGFDRAENARLIARHEEEHDAGTAFAFAVLSPWRDREYGCVYVRPLSDYVARTGTRIADAPDHAALVTFWLLDDATARQTTGECLAEIREWTASWAGPALLRVATAETGSIAAAHELGLAEVAATDQPRPYRWFALHPTGG